jgi:hypothetical protein
MGGMGGGGMAGTMPPMMGMMMLAGTIVRLTGDFDSWDMQSQALSYRSGFGMMGGMGGMGGGMGGMGGMGMGGMGMGGMGMGGMGGGFRSVPATGLPNATLQPGQTRKLSTRVVSMSPPTDEGLVNLPVKGEPLQIGDVADAGYNELVQKALRLLAAEKAPDSVAQLVLWRLTTPQITWQMIARLSRKWANASEIALAQQFVARLSDRDDVSDPHETGTLYVEVDSADAATDALAADLRNILKESLVLGLVARDEVPKKPEGPAVACRIRLAGTAEKPEAIALVAVSDSNGKEWVSSGKFTLPLTKVEGREGKLEAVAVADSLASGLLERLVHVTVLKGKTRNNEGKLVHRIRIDNASPLILNGLMLVGSDPESKAAPTTLLGISVAPRKSLTVPASEDAVERLGLKKGARAFAADLSGL